MKPILATVLIAAALAVVTPEGLMAETQKVTVSVSHSGDDTVGQQLSFALREAIRASTGYELVSGPKATVRVSLITLDPEKHESSAETWSVASVVITMRNHNSFKPRDPQT